MPAKRHSDRSDLIIDHPILGRSISLAEGYRCCKCGRDCDGENDDVPLIIWDKSGRAAWVFCLICEKEILPLIYPSHSHIPARH